MLFSSNFLNDCHAHGFWQIDSCLACLRAADGCRSNHVQRTWSLFLIARFRNLQVWLLMASSIFQASIETKLPGTLITSYRENISFPLQQLYLDVCQTQKDNNVSHTENKSYSMALFLKSVKCLCFHSATHFGSSPSSVLCLLFCGLAWLCHSLNESILELLSAVLCFCACTSFQIISAKSTYARALSERLHWKWGSNSAQQIGSRAPKHWRL